MPNEPGSVAPRNFGSTSVPGLSAEARKAVNAAFEAMSAWRTEIVEEGERRSEEAIGKMAEAAEELGWPPQIVEATGTQMKTIGRMQVQTINNMMDAWEEQIKSPNSPTAMLSKLKSSANSGTTGSRPSADPPQMQQLNPFEFYMQVAEYWRKAFADAMAFWSKAAKP